MPPVSRGLQALAWVSLGLAVVMLFGVWPLRGDDLHLHLALGQWIWTHGWVPTTDPFSYLTKGQPFIAHSWLSEVLLYGLESTTGTLGFLALRFTLIVASLLLAWRVARCLKASCLAIMVLSPFVLGLVWGRCELRPALFSTFLLAIELSLLISAHTGRRSWRWLWLLPPCFALWINLHPGWGQGLAMLLATLAALVAMEIRSRWLGSGGISAIPLLQLGLVLVACVAALLINPYGWRLLVFPLEMQAPWIRALGREFHSPLAYWDWGRFPGVFFFPRVMQVLFITYTAGLVGTCLLALRRWRTVDVLPIVLMGLWLVIGLWHIRAVPDMTLITAPLVGAQLPLARWRLRPWAVLLWGGLWLVAVGLVLRVVLLGFAHAPSWWKWHVEEPTCAIAVVGELSRHVTRPLRVFGSDEREWLLYRLPGRVQVEVTWEYVAGEQRMAEFLTARLDQARMEAFLERYQVDVVFLRTLALRLADHFPGLRSFTIPRGWDVAHVENTLVVLVRSSDAWQQVPMYRHLLPWREIVVTPANAEPILEESVRALSCRGFNPEAANFAWRPRVAALQLLGRPAEAAEASWHIPPTIQVGEFVW